MEDISGSSIDDIHPTRKIELEKERGDFFFRNCKVVKGGVKVVKGGVKVV